MNMIKKYTIPLSNIARKAKAVPRSLLTEKEAATILNVTPSCLQAWRYRGEGPQFIKISGRCVRYRWLDLQEWVDDHRCSSTSQYKEGKFS
jgi:predicted DNA-binding transcriptional regulator AlpA